MLAAAPFADSLTDSLLIIMHAEHCSGRPLRLATIMRCCITTKRHQRHGRVYLGSVAVLSLVAHALPIAIDSNAPVVRIIARAGAHWLDG